MPALVVTPLEKFSIPIKCYDQSRGKDLRKLETYTRVKWFSNLYSKFSNIMQATTKKFKCFLLSWPTLYYPKTKTARYSYKSHYQTTHSSSEVTVFFGDMPGWTSGILWTVLWASLWTKASVMQTSSNQMHFWILQGVLVFHSETLALEEKSEQQQGMSTTCNGPSKYGATLNTHSCHRSIFFSLSSQG